MKPGSRFVPVRSVLLGLATLVSAGCSSISYVTVETPPDAQIYVNGRLEGRGPSARVPFDFSTCDRVYLQVACKGFAPSWVPYTAAQVPSDLRIEVHLTPTR